MNPRAKSFYRSVIPAICATVISGLYVVVDGIFVGQGVGTEGLAAVNISLPLILFISSIGMMLAMGGATLTSIALGKNEPKSANNIFRITLAATVIFSLTITAICLIFPSQTARLLGSSENLMSESTEYIFYFVMFSTFATIAVTLSVFVKNDNNPNLAMYGMIAGAVANIFLDWLFVFPLDMGLMGAALASGLGQILACMVLSLHFICKKGELRLGIAKREKGLLREIVKIGTPEFVTQMSSPVCTLLFNLLVIDAFGDIGVSAFSVTSYIIAIIVLAFVGLAQGLQPLLSRSLGERDPDKISYYLTKGLKLNIIMAVVIYAIMFFFGGSVIKIFNDDAQLVVLAKAFLNVYGISFLFASVNIVYTTYFLAVKKTKQSLIIASLRSFIANTAFILLTPLVLGDDFIFVGIVIAETIVMVVSLVLFRKDNGNLPSAYPFNR